MANKWNFDLQEHHVLEIEKLLAYEIGADLRRVTIRRKGAGWMMIVAVTIDGKPLVCFHDGHSFAGAWESFYVHYKADKIRWHIDKYV